MRKVCLGLVPAVWLSAVVALAQTTNVVVAIGMTGTAYGVPGNIEMESVPPHGAPGSITFNGTSINFDSIELIGGAASTELLVSATANTNQGASGEVLIFFDLSPTLTVTGRTGTLVLTHGTGPYFGSSISLAYKFTCTSACATTINANKSGPFDATFTANGAALLPSTIQIPRVGGGAPSFVSPPSGTVIQRITNFFAPQVYGSGTLQPPVPPPPPTTGMAAPFPMTTTDAASSGGVDGALIFATPVQFVPTTYTASATCANLPGECWMTIPNPTGSVAAFVSGSVTANLDWSKLPAGVYPSSVSITQSDATDAPVVQNTTLGLILTDSSPPILQLSETAIPFQAVAGASTAQQAHAIQLSTTAAAIPYSATASTLTGSNWLSVSAGSGTVPSNGAANVNIAVNPAGLAAGTYFGKVDIGAPTAATALQSVEVTLTVAASAPPGPIISANGLLFVAPQNTNPAAQTVTLSTFSSQPITVTGGAEEDNSGTWLKVAAPSTSLVSGAPIMQTVSINTTGLAPGAYTGSVVETTSTASYPIAVVLIVTPSGTCTPTQLLPVFTSLSDNFELPAGLPVSMQAQIVDDCGGPLTAGAVSLNLSSDAAVAMTPLGNGLWAGTWEPHGALIGVNQVNLSAQSAAGLAGSTSISGTIDANTNIPVVAPGGIGSAAVSTLGSIVSPGGFISIYGSNLAPSVAQSTSFPLQTTLAGTQVFLAGQALPLQFVSAGQINAIVPIGTAVNRFQELLIAQNGMYSLPETVVLSAATPAVFSLSQSVAAIIVYKANATPFVASPTQPASAGDVLAVYCTGLGAVSPAIPDGLASPLTSFSSTVNTVTATVGGLPAQVGFSGLAPGSAGLYQVNMVVPAGITPGPSVPVVLTELGFPSTTLTVAIQ